jgi:hypothetical protein
MPAKAMPSPPCAPLDFLICDRAMKEQISPAIGLPNVINEACPFYVAN